MFAVRAGFLHMPLLFVASLCCFSFFHTWEVFLALHGDEFYYDRFFPLRCP